MMTADDFARIASGLCLAVCDLPMGRSARRFQRPLLHAGHHPEQPRDEGTPAGRQPRGKPVIGRRGEDAQGERAEEVLAELQEEVGRQNGARPDPRQVHPNDYREEQHPQPSLE